MGYPAFDAAQLALTRYKQIYERQTPEVVCLPGAAYADFQRELAARIEGRICHLLPITSEEWDVDDFEGLIWRQAVESTVSLECIYVLPHRGFGGTSYERQLARDTAAGISVHTLVVSELSPALASLQLDEFWVLNRDGVIILSREGVNAGQTIVTVSRRESDVAQCLDKWQRLKDLLLQAAPAIQILNLQEPLVSSADLLSDVSAVLCSSDHIDAKSCLWYHSVWQFLRLVDLVSTPSWHHNFYNAQIAEALVGKQSPSILISGTADYSMLAYVIAAASAANTQPAITVADLCATPLFACRWYAQRTKQSVVTVQDDVITSSLLEKTAFDLICSDAFLTRFSDQEVGKVLNRWVNLLKPAGRVITTIRLHPRGQTLNDIEDAVQQFANNATVRIERWRPFLRTPIETIITRSMLYARRMHSYNHGNADEVVQLFARNSFDVLFTEEADVPGELAPTVYLRLHARKRS